MIIVTHACNIPRILFVQLWNVLKYPFRHQKIHLDSVIDKLLIFHFLPCFCTLTFIYIYIYRTALIFLLVLKIESVRTTQSHFIFIYCTIIASRFLFLREYTFQSETKNGTQALNLQKGKNWISNIIDKWNVSIMRIYDLFYFGMASYYGTSILIIITDITVDKSSDLIANLFLLPLTSMS